MPLINVKLTEGAFAWPEKHGVAVDLSIAK
jgi:phenylpyruvate tautomerase PptA (4-oxalocrotonate tautomerase family)